MGQQYLGEIRIVAFTFAPKGWTFCNGQLLPINQNQALFSLLGTAYGGNGTTNFQLPNLQGRVPAHAGSTIVQGQAGGEAFHTLLSTEMPQHSHTMKVDATGAATSNAFLPAAGNALGQSTGATSQGGSFPVNIYSTVGTPLVAQATGDITIAGNNQPHENRQPYTVLNFIIALTGIFPSRN